MACFLQVGDFSIHQLSAVLASQGLHCGGGYAAMARLNARRLSLYNFILQDMWSYLAARMRQTTSAPISLSHVVNLVALWGVVVTTVASLGSSGGAFAADTAAMDAADAGTSEAAANVESPDGEAEGPVPLGSQNVNKAFVTLVGITLAVTFATLAIVMKKNRVSNCSSF